MASLLLAALYAACLASAQEPGTTPDAHPPLTTYKCTTEGGCVAQDTSIVIDWASHWIHTASGETCTTSTGVNETLCPNEATCARNCVVEGVSNYTANGVMTSGDTLTMYQYMESDGTYADVSPRLYLMAPGDINYELLHLNGQELSFTVDLSTLPCGENGALYLSQMDPTGGRNLYEIGGAAYGSGYCDAQCPIETWRNGALNLNDTRYCCNEMDILEANSVAAQMTPHPCYANGTGCDSSGCGFNPYNQGYHSYYGPGLTVDTTKPFTVVTQFLTNDGTTTGTLTEIIRKYIQDSVTLAPAVAGGDNITESWCTAHDSVAASYGGLATMGKALEEGMVLIFSIWNDPTQYMDWLDEGNNGPCNATAGDPTTILAEDPTTHVVFSNIRWGDIGSTTS